MADFPDFYDPQRIGTLFYPDVQQIAGAAGAADLPPAAAAEQQVELLVVDMQVDFCHEEGSLFVPGALGDIRRLIEFIYRHAGQITNITCTLDSHLPYQIFHPSWWADAEGNHPPPLTIITAADVESGRWEPLVMPDYSRQYVQRLEEQASKLLTIWPYHVLIGGMGNALDPELWSAIIWHSLARKSQPAWLLKGRIPQSEHYSAIQPEIPVPEHPEGGKQVALLESLTAADVIFVAGEAQSHCVLETLEDMVVEFKDSPDILQKIYVLSDCTSAVQHPEVDFEAMALEAFDEYAQEGVHFIKSTDPMPFLEKPRPGPAGNQPVSGLQRMARWRAQTTEIEAT